MIHYHGTPLGGTRASGAEFAQGRFLLVPWRRPEDLALCQEAARGFMVDNSAFTFWRNGETPEWGEYIKWCREFARNPRFHFAVIPDVIDGTESDNDELIRLWDRRAYHPVAIEGCPVWHLHESLGRLDRLCRRYPRIALGSSGDFPNPGVGDGWWDRMAEAFGVICDDDGYPRAKIHGLRMLRAEIVTAFPFSSCDSTNAAQNGARESLKNGVDSGWGRMTIARRIEAAQSPSTFTPTLTQARLL